jgi:hypothetical protein
VSRGYRRLVNAASLTSVSPLRAAPFPAGLVLGRDNAGELVVVRAFRPEPTHIALVGGAWVARLLVFRTLALGASVVVSTTTPEQWRGLGQIAGHPYDFRVAGPAEPVVKDRAGPLLQVVDVAAAGAGAGPPVTEGQTRLTVLPKLSPWAVEQLAAAHLLLLQRLDAAEVGALQAWWRLGGATGDLLQRLDDDMLAVVGGQADRYTWLTPTSIEQRLFGPPRRSEG